MSESPYDELVPKEELTITPQESPMESKSLFTSKTFWVNLLSAVAAITATLGGSDIIQDNPQIAGYAATGLALVNVILRLVTNKPVTIT